MDQDLKIVKFLEERLAAHEGGARAVEIGYDDATFDYMICQGGKVLGCSRSLGRSFELAISGKQFD